MANEKIEIDIVLNDGSVAKAFAAIPKAAQDTAKKTQNSLSSIENDFKKLGSGLSAIRGSILGLGAAIGVGFGIKKLGDFIGDTVKEAVAGQESLNNLANALRSAGDLSEANIKKFRDFANETQRTTKFADDQVLSLSALARNYSKTSDQAIELTKAAIQLSAATGIDVNTAVDQLGGTLQGVSGRIGKLIPGFKGLSEEALKSGDAIKLVNERFGGSAESQVNTYAGGIAQLKNEFSDFLEGIGNLIIRSPALVAVFTEVGNIFREFASSVSNLTSSNQDVLGPIIKQAIQFGLTFNDFVIRPFEVLGNAVKVSFNLIKLQFDFAIAAIGKLAGAIGFVLSKFSATQSLGDNLLAFNDSSEEIFVKQLGNVADSAANVFDQSLANGIDETLSRIQTAVNNASTKLLDEVKIDPNQGKKFASSILPPIDQEALKYQQELGVLKGEALLLRSELEALGETNLFDSFNEQIASLPTNLQIATVQTKTEIQAQIAEYKKLQQEISTANNQIKESIRTGLTNAISQGVQSLVTALTTGKNAFKAFAGAALSIIGDLMIQIGTQIVLTSKAIQALTAALANPLGGAGLAIAAGIGLIAAGVFVKGIASSLGGSASAPGSSLTSPLTPATPVSGGVSDELQGRQASVQVTVEGNVYDPQGTGLAIADLLKEAGFDGAVIA
jgi:hypothetical protein